MLKPTNFTRAVFFIIGDAALSFISLLFAYALRFNFHVPATYFHNFFQIYLLLLGSKFFFLALFKQYQFTWRYYGLIEAKRLFIALLLAYLFSSIILWIFYDYFIPFPRSAIVIDFVLSLILLSALRLAKRIYLESFVKKGFKTAAIYGISNKTKHLIDAFLSGEWEYKPIAVIEDTRAGSYFNTIKVLSEEEFFASSLPVETLIIAKDLPSSKLQSISQKAKNLGIKEIKIASLTKDELKDLDIEDLLARKPKDLDSKAIANFVKGKTILITGAGGSIGSELVRQCKQHGAKKIVAVEMSEYNLYTLTQEFADIDARLCDVTDKEEIEPIIAETKPDIILHAAAYKHVPLAELNPKATVKNNILGTKNVLDIAIAYSVPHFILISTDKAVNPTNIMGATKRVCELYAQNVPGAHTTIAAVRFGNVLGSSGSVIPKFKEQIKKGGPVTVTHPKITRYFMLTSEACQLVLQAGAIAKGREIFILDMGKPVKIVDLAKKMMELYNKEVPIEFIGLRPGEKLFEELLLEGVEEKTKYQSIFIAKATPIDLVWLDDTITKLLQATDKEQIIHLLKQLVPEFRHTPHAQPQASSHSASHANKSAGTLDRSKTHQNLA